MALDELARAIVHDGVAVVFVNVLLQQLGFPIPAVPTMLVAGSLALGAPQAALMLGAAVLASLLADLVWYGAGRLFGYRVLAGLCRLSINPASCVSETERRFLRWGLWSLVIAKFVPGFSTVAPPVAGALRMWLPGFVAGAAAGALLWSGAAIAAGWLLRGRLELVLARLGEQGPVLALALGALFALWLAWKLWQKSRFARLADILRISPEELAEAMRSEAPPLLLDLRGPTMLAATGLVPGAVGAELGRLLEIVADHPKGKPIVTLCACPGDATAVQAARELLAHGFTSVRPLRGGFEALPDFLRPGAGAATAADGGAA